MPYESYVIVTKTVNGKNIGVSVADIKAALGVSDASFNALCKSAKIAKWNIYRPIRLAQREAVSLQQRRNLHFGLGYAWTFGTNMAEAAFEATHPYGTAEYSSELALKYAGRHWEDNKPGGGAATPYRISDFAVKLNDNTDPQGNLATRRGYHVIAPRPTTIDLTTQGVDVLADGSWEVNTAAANQLAFTYRTTIVSDGGLGLAHIALGYRAYIQVYEDKRVAQGGVWKEWYQFNPVLTAVGSDIITDNTTSVSISFNCLAPSSTPYYIVFGFIKSDAYGNVTAQSEYCFLSPYDDSERNLNPQFIKRVFFRIHSTRNVRLGNVSCYTNLNYWMTDGGGVWYLTNGVISELTGELTYQLQINGGSIVYRFVGANTSEVPTATRHLLQLIVVDRDHAASDAEISNNGFILTPGYVNSGVWTYATYVDITNTDPDVYSSFYARGGQRPTDPNEIKYYIMYMRTKTSASAAWSQWTEVNTVYVWNKNYPY